MPKTITENQGNIAILTLNNGTTNAISPELVAELSEALNQIRDQAEVFSRICRLCSDISAPRRLSDRFSGYRCFRIFCRICLSYFLLLFCIISDKTLKSVKNRYPNFILLSRKTNTVISAFERIDLKNL